MRLFVAIPLPPIIKAQLGELKEPINNVRWQDVSQLHLTLKFLGEASKERAIALQAALGDIKQPAFTLSLKGVGYFPERGQPRVLWAGIEENIFLRPLRDKVEKVCVSQGFEAGNKSFKPHITLARGEDIPKNDILQFIKQHRSFGMRNIPIGQYVLYESKLHARGSEHIVLKTFPLDQ